jgi:hypothetical protein
MKLLSKDALAQIAGGAESLSAGDLSGALSGVEVGIEPWNRVTRERRTVPAPHPFVMTKAPYLPVESCPAAETI